MPTASGQLRHLVTLERPTPGEPNAFGERPPARYQVVRHAWAAVVPIKAAEVIAAGRQVGEVTHTVLVRAVPGERISHTWRVTLPDGRVLQILGAIDAEERGVTWELLCRETVVEVTP